METGSTHSELILVSLKKLLAITSRKKKWTNTEKNLKVAEVMILQEANTIRDNCQMCRVMQKYCHEKGFV